MIEWMDRWNIICLRYVRACDLLRMKTPSVYISGRYIPLHSLVCDLKTSFWARLYVPEYSTLWGQHHEVSTLISIHFHTHVLCTATIHQFRFVARVNCEKRNCSKWNWKRFPHYLQNKRHCTKHTHTHTHIRVRFFRLKQKWFFFFKIKKNAYSSIKLC